MMNEVHVERKLGSGELAEEELMGRHWQQGSLNEVDEEQV